MKKSFLTFFFFPKLPFPTLAARAPRCPARDPLSPVPPDEEPFPPCGRPPLKSRPEIFGACSVSLCPPVDVDPPRTSRRHPSPLRLLSSPLKFSSFLGITPNKLILQRNISFPSLRVLEIVVTSYSSSSPYFIDIPSTVNVPFDGCLPGGQYFPLFPSLSQPDALRGAPG